MTIAQDVEKGGWPFVSGYLLTELAAKLDKAEIDEVANGLPIEIAQYLVQRRPPIAELDSISNYGKLISAMRRRVQP